MNQTTTAADPTPAPLPRGHAAEATPFNGGAPRLAPLDVSELNPELMAIAERMIAVNEAINARGKSELQGLMAEMSEAERAARIAALPEIIRTMLRHAELFARQTEIGIQLLGRGALAPRDRELVVLRTLWLCQAPYGWGEHVHVARSIGISSEEIERITRGPDAHGWSAHERALLAAADELKREAMIGDATWAALAQTLDDKQLIELPIVIGQYQTVAYYQNSLRLRLHDGNAGLKAR